MGRHRVLKSVLRYMIETDADFVRWQFRVLDRNNNWVVAVKNWADLKLFEDREEARRFLIEKQFKEPKDTWLNARVLEKWLEL